MEIFVGEPSPQERLAQFPTYPLTADLTSLPEGDRAALPYLIRAGKLLDELYLTQWWQHNLQLREKLVQSGDKDVLEVFNMYKGPYGIHNLILPPQTSTILKLCLFNRFLTYILFVICSSQ